MRALLMIKTDTSFESEETPSIGSKLSRLPAKLSGLSLEKASPSRYSQGRRESAGALLSLEMPSNKNRKDKRGNIMPTHSDNPEQRLVTPAKAKQTHDEIRRL